MSDTADTSTVAGTETPAQAPQPVDAPQTQSSRRGSGWFRRGARSGIIAGVVVVVAAAFFTIGWFTSTRGDHGQTKMINGIYQKMGVRQRGGPLGGTGQRGQYRWQGYPGRRGGMMVPQQGQGQGQVVPTPQPQPNGPTTPQGQITPQGLSAQQGYLGVGVETVTPALQQQFGLSSSSGVLVASIDSSGPAFKAGIQQGDVIASINGTSVAQADEVVGLIGKMKAGDSASVTIDRKGQSLTLQVTLVERPAPASITG